MTLNYDALVAQLRAAAKHSEWTGVKPDEPTGLGWVETTDPLLMDAAAAIELLARLIATAPDLLGALKAEQAADEAFDAADEYTHRADAEDWLNDPTGSLHVNAARQRANDMRAKAKEMRIAAIAKASA
jgi:hypothetical protein